MAISPPTDYEKQALIRILGDVLDDPSIFDGMTTQHQVAVLNTALAQCSERRRRHFSNDRLPPNMAEWHRIEAEYHLAFSDLHVVRMAIKRLEDEGNRERP